MPTINYAPGVTINDPLVLDSDDIALQVLSGTATQAGEISELGGSWGFEKIGAGTLTLTADNSYTGPTDISEGTLFLAPTSGLILTTSAFNVDEGATLSFASGLFFAEIGSLAGGGDVDIADVFVVVTGEGEPDTTFSGSITGNGFFSKEGEGTLTLTGDSDIGGFLEVCGCDGSTLVIDGGSFRTFGQVNAQTIVQGTLVVTNGGTLDTPWLQNVGTVIITGAGSKITATDDTTIDFLLKIDAGGFLDSQSPSATLDGEAIATVTGNGSLWSIEGLLDIGFNDSFAGPADVTIADGGRVTSAQTKIVSDSTLHLGSGGLAGILETETIDHEGAIFANFTNTSTLAADIFGAGTLAKAGAGTLILSGANTYTGATSVNGGVLQVDGTLVDSLVSVGNGGALGGNGTTGVVAIASGGTLAPGTSAGILNTGNVSLASGAAFAAELGGTSPGAGGYDQLKVTGSIALGGSTLDLSLINAFRPANGSTYAIIDNDGGDAVSGTFAGLANGATFTVPAGTYRISYSGGDGNDVVLTALNDAPTLLGFGPSVTYSQVQVNTAPQIIDGNVTFDDPDDNFNGGSLVVAGLLAEDIVSIRNQGTGAGEIGFASGNITFGGTLIGTATGGAGTTLTVTFNAAANSAAVEALIENLTYSDLSLTPTPSRTLTLTVTDNEMASTGAVPDTVNIIADSHGVTIIGTPDADLIDASHTVPGQPLPTSKDDLIKARGGDDIVSALAGDDHVYGAGGNDRLKGNSGNDHLFGAAGDDRLFGNAGNDHLDGGRGANTLTGGAGDDVFLFTTLPGEADGPPWISPLTFSRITDFTLGEDKIGLSRAIFGSLANVHYKAATGALVFDDPDSDHPVQFAILAKGLDLHASDFLFV